MQNLISQKMCYLLQNTKVFLCDKINFRPNSKISSPHFLKFLARVRALVCVRMVFLGELIVGLLYILLAGILVNAKDLIIVAGIARGGGGNVSCRN